MKQIHLFKTLQFKNWTTWLFLQFRI